MLFQDILYLAAQSSDAAAGGGGGAVSNTYTFDEANDTDVGSITNWVLESAESKLKTNGSGKLKRSSTTGSSHWYREGVLVSTHQIAQMQTGTPSGVTAPRLVVFGNWNGQFSGYTLFPQSATNLRLTRYKNDADTTLDNFTVAETDNLTIKLEAQVVSGNVEVKVYVGGVQQGTTHTDSTADKLTSGYNGLYVNGTSASTADNGDDFVSNLQAA